MCVVFISGCAGYKVHFMNDMNPALDAKSINDVASEK